MTDPAAHPGESPGNIWLMIADRLRETVTSESYLTWFMPIEAVSLGGGLLTLQVPTRFHKEWIHSHYNHHLRRAIADTVGEGIELDIVVKVKQMAPLPSDKPAGARREQAPGESTWDSKTHLFYQYRFDNFIEGDCNRLARRAAMSLAKNPRQPQLNPLLIYGGVGLGKTHLMHAIGNQIVGRGISSKVLYTNSVDFTAEFIKAIQQNRAYSFTRMYRNVDVLLLDDVQFFMAKEKTQEEFFHIFNALHLEGKHLVLSSDRPPKELEGFNRRLISRLQWGMVSELKTPDFETRLAIVNHLAGSSNGRLPEEVASFVVSNITDNIRDLESAVNNILNRSQLQGREISVELARDVLNQVSGRVARSVSVELIQEVVAREFGILSDLLRARTRRKEVVYARQIAMFLSTEMTKLTLNAVGLHFGGRDHATVIHARKSTERMMKTSLKDTETVAALRRKIELASL